MKILRSYYFISVLLLVFIGSPFSNANVPDLNSVFPVNTKQSDVLTPLFEVFADTTSGKDWDPYPINANPGVGKRWVLQENISDDFNYKSPAKIKSKPFRQKWKDWYHNSWTGPGLTIWSRTNSYVRDGMLTLFCSRVKGTNNVHTGIITSKKRVQYPIYIETRAKIANTVIASNAWLLSPDDTQEIDFLESYGGEYSENADADLSWFAQRIHISHHVFIRKPFQDYQPKDPGSWYHNGSKLWKDDFHTYGVYWKSPWHLEYYIDGEMVRKVVGEHIIDPKKFTTGTGLYKEMDIIINMEDQDWRSKKGITPSDNELSADENTIFKVDWIRVYKPQ